MGYQIAVNSADPPEHKILVFHSKLRHQVSDTAVFMTKSQALINKYRHFSYDRTAGGNVSV